MTLSPPVRIVALAGLLLALAGAGALEVPKLRHRLAPLPAPARTAPAAPAPAPAQVAVPGVPFAVTDALRRHGTVVAFVYSPSSPGDRVLLAEARAGARAARAAFVPLDVGHDAVAAAVYAWTGRPADPEALVVRRPGRIVFAVQGATDRVAVAQAATSAR